MDRGKTRLAVLSHEMGKENTFYNYAQQESASSWILASL